MKFKFGLILFITLIIFSTTVSALSVDNLHFNNKVAGEDSTLIFRIVNDKPVTVNNINILVNWSSVFQKNRYSHIKSLRPYQTMFVVQTVNFAQTGKYTGHISISSDSSNLSVDFPEDIGPNPQIEGPVIHPPFPKQDVNETTTKKFFNLSTSCYKIPHIYNYISDTHTDKSNIMIFPAGDIGYGKGIYYGGYNQTDESIFYCPEPRFTGATNLSIKYYDLWTAGFPKYYKIPVNVKPIITSFTNTPAIVDYDFTINESFPVENVFVGISTSKDMKDCNATVQTGCLYYEKDASSYITHTFHSNDFKEGNLKLYSHVCNLNVCSDVYTHEMRIRPKVHVFGYVKDIFSNKTIPSAKIIVNGIETKSDSNGYYSLYTNSSVPEWGNTTISAEDYTTYHTWVNTSNDERERNFTLIPTSFDWKLYDHTMRGNVGKIPEGISTVHWYTQQPDIVILNHSTEHVSSVAQQVSDVIWNIKNRLVKFNPVNTNPKKIKVIPEYQTDWWKDVMSVGWAENIPIGSYSIDSIGPVLIDANAAFNPAGGYVPNKDSAVYNQELGSCMGALNEPDYVGSENKSVFAGYTVLTTYSKLDYEMGKIYNERSALHYFKNDAWNGTPLDDQDWEIRPDIVKKRLDFALENMKYLKSSEENNKIVRTVSVILDNGSLKSWTFHLNNIPDDLINSLSLEYIKGLTKQGILPSEALTKKENLEHKFSEPHFFFIRAGHDSKNSLRNNHNTYRTNPTRYSTIKNNVKKTYHIYMFHPGETFKFN